MPPSPSPVITPDVAEWIVLQVRHPHSHPLQKQKQTQKQNLANILVSSGLKGLNVRELKLLEKRVYNMDAVKAELSNEKERERKSQHVRRLLPSNAKKAQFVEAVGRAFFRDDACTVYNERLLRDVRDELREARSSGSPGAAAAEFASAQTSSTTTATTTTTTRTAGAAGTQTQTNSHSSRKRPNHQMTQPPTPTQQQQQQQPPDHCMHALLARISEATAAAAQRQQQQQQQQQHQFQYRYNQHQHQHRPPSNYDPHGTAWASTATATALQGGGFRLPVQKPLPPQQQRQPFQPQQPLLLPLQLQQQPAAVSGSSSSSSSDPDAQPRTPTEALLLPQLLQMGFARQEILDGIRQLTSQSQSQSQSDDTASTAASPPASACAAATVTADDLMLHLVSQREAAEEARREDAVRLQSEDSKHEDRERREKHRTAALAKANSWDELSRIFPESWILRRLLQRGGEGKGAAAATATATATMEGSVLGVGKRETESRAEFLEILGLEEKSRRWYGWKLPAGYFEKVGSRLLGHYFHSCEDHKNNTNNNNRSNNKNSNNNKKATATATVTTIVAYLRSEKRKLRSGLYELEEQRDGQPKIFLSERLEDNAGTKNEVVVIDDDDDDDDDDEY